MSTSNSTNFSITRDEIIGGALRLSGVVAEGSTPTSDQITTAAQALNMLIKALQVDGMPLWAVKEYTMSLTASTGSYNIGIGETINTPKPLKVLQAYLRNTTSNIDIPLRLVTRDEYNRLGNKISTGVPSQLWYNPQRDKGTITIYPIPGTTEASTYTITLIYQRPFEDFDASTDNPDFPQEWYEAIKYGLAVRMAGEYGVPLEDRRQLMQEYILIKNDALGFGTEEGSFFIFPRDR